ncbi:MAG: ribonuclease E inhibitor RraB [Pirellulaceae bacterium]|nr:ribonuclease E inhibitor RraB [Planctomycetales bacterium]MCA9206345.1 ribonuclease E inhibitor RraB [Planctomycetales bacterium]MCA9211002.1 ribonuclease E inhibitor RraB [Planctomycetales bacterium]MCA9224329.1 ribonuclease E inhibitor RraB [Planctomycetales bacterium]
MTTYPDDADGAVLASLAAHGVDMSAPLVIEFAVAAPDEASAHSIGQALAEAGYDAEVEYDEGEPDEDGMLDEEDEEFGPSWTVYVDIEMVPEYDELMRIQAELDRIARPLGGNSDGWGVTLN